MAQPAGMAMPVSEAETFSRPGAARYGITVAFELEDGAFDAFHRLVSENARESVSSEAGCLRFDVATPAPGADEVFLYELYADRAAFDLHLASAHFRRFDESTRNLVRRKTVQSYSVEENAKGDVAR